MRRRTLYPLLVGAIVMMATLALTQAGNARSTVVPPPPGTNTVAAEAATCASLYSVPVNLGPDPLSACQWDMRAIGATSSGSYAVDQGAGARIGDIDTGIDLTNSAVMPNVDVAASCVFLYADTPTADPAEQVTRGGLLGSIWQQVPAIVERARSDLDARRPATWRRCGGYNLDRLLDLARRFPHGTRDTTRSVASGIIDP